MTLIEFAHSRGLDWITIVYFLKDNGFVIEENPNAVIGDDWLIELIREFPRQEDNSESELSENERPSYDEKTLQKLEEEKAQAFLKNEKLDISQVEIDPKQLTLDIIIERLKYGEIQLDPEYQRRENLWSPEQQSKLIESILIKLPLPAFYFDGANDGKWAVVDGLQRLSAIKNFVLDKSLKLEGLDFLNLRGKTYDDLPRPLHRRIKETVIFAFLIKPGTPNELKYNIFKRINTGGLILTPQEIRHALNQGEPAKLLKDLAGLDVFKKATGYSLELNRRMVDRDFINRFIAFYLQGFSLYERGPDGLDGFLNKGMALINEKNKNEIKVQFIKAMQTAFKIFGNDAFRKRAEFPPKNRRKPLNKALFEIWAVNLAQCSNEQRRLLIEKKEEVMKASSELLRTDGYFDVSITYSTGDPNRVKYRFGKIKELIQSILNSHDS
ncbi:MAG: hypothetical protein KIPDCIKN_03542 [Haliscomenobacter sp.]|nr:hypothetical protein [Haliscomenobacter sp.]